MGSRAMYCILKGSVGAQLFQLFLNISFVPRAWKETTIISVSKKASWELTTMLGESLDLLQFAYKAKQGVESASLTL